MTEKILNLIHREHSDLSYEEFTFPDGQPHFKLLEDLRELELVQVLTRLSTPLDFLRLAIVMDVLRGQDAVVRVNISYMLGARMDRPIDDKQPYTLHAFTNLVNAVAAPSRVRVLDPHSAPTLAWLGAEALHPDLLVDHAIKHVFEFYGTSAVIVVPDAGACDRVARIMYRLKMLNELVQCRKKRDSSTGALTGFEIVSGHEFIHGKPCLIVDDICDGGGTFVGQAKLLRDAGAAGVGLCVTHGIFSKGYKLEGIDHIYTTDSYKDHNGSYDPTKVHVLTRFLEKVVRG